MANPNFNVNQTTGAVTINRFDDALAELTHLVEGRTYNLGELVLSDKGKLKIINNHKNTTWFSNDTLTSYSDNKRVRQAIGLLIKGKFGQDGQTKSAYYDEVYRRLTDAEYVGQPLTRREMCGYLKLLSAKQEFKGDVSYRIDIAETKVAEEEKILKFINGPQLAASGGLKLTTEEINRIKELKSSNDPEAKKALDELRAKHENIKDRFAAELARSRSKLVDDLFKHEHTTLQAVWRTEQGLSLEDVSTIVRSENVILAKVRAGCISAFKEGKEKATEFQQGISSNIRKEIRSLDRTFMNLQQACDKQVEKLEEVQRKVNQGLNALKINPEQALQKKKASAAGVLAIRQAKYDNLLAIRQVLALFTQKMEGNKQVVVYGEKHNDTYDFEIGGVRHYCDRTDKPLEDQGSVSSHAKGWMGYELKDDKPCAIMMQKDDGSKFKEVELKFYNDPEVTELLNSALKDAGIDSKNAETVLDGVRERFKNRRYGSEINDELKDLKSNLDEAQAEYDKLKGEKVESGSKTNVEALFKDELLSVIEKQLEELNGLSRTLADEKARFSTLGDNLQTNGHLEAMKAVNGMGNTCAREMEVLKARSDSLEKLKKSLTDMNGAELKKDNLEAIAKQLTDIINQRLADFKGKGNEAQEVDGGNQPKQMEGVQFDTSDLENLKSACMEKLTSLLQQKEGEAPVDPKAGEAVVKLKDVITREFASYLGGGNENQGGVKRERFGAADLMKLKSSLMRNFEAALKEKSGLPIAEANEIVAKLKGVVVRQFDDLTDSKIGLFGHLAMCKDEVEKVTNGLRENVRAVNNDLPTSALDVLVDQVVGALFDRERELGTRKEDVDRLALIAVKMEKQRFTSDEKSFHGLEKLAEEAMMREACFKTFDSQIAQMASEKGLDAKKLKELVVKDLKADLGNCLKGIKSDMRAALREWVNGGSKPEAVDNVISEIVRKTNDQMESLRMLFTKPNSTERQSFLRGFIAQHRKELIESEAKQDLDKFERDLLNAVGIKTQEVKQPKTTESPNLPGKKYFDDLAGIMNDPKGTPETRDAKLRLFVEDYNKKNGGISSGGVAYVLTVNMLKDMLEEPNFLAEEQRKLAKLRTTVELMGVNWEWLEPYLDFGIGMVVTKEKMLETALAKLQMHISDEKAAIVEALSKEKEALSGKDEKAGDNVAVDKETVDKYKDLRKRLIDLNKAVVAQQTMFNRMLVVLNLIHASSQDTSANPEANPNPAAGRDGNEDLEQANMTVLRNVVKQFDVIKSQVPKVDKVVGRDKKDDNRDQSGFYAQTVVHQTVVQVVKLQTDAYEKFAAVQMDNLKKGIQIFLSADKYTLDEKTGLHSLTENVDLREQFESFNECVSKNKKLGNEVKGFAPEELAGDDKWNQNRNWARYTRDVSTFVTQLFCSGIADTKMVRLPEEFIQADVKGGFNRHAVEDVFTSTYVF